MLEEVGDILDVWVYWDDLSGQNGPLINPKWYEKNLMPLHRKLFDYVKSKTKRRFSSTAAVLRDPGSHILLMSEWIFSIRFKLPQKGWTRLV